ncbi:MAG: radical SAM protein [Firmicutes bacterium]|nr:radical SAM protein [Bacillota bacterium]
MLTGIHFLLTYKCPYECEHCFVYSSPRAKGTFTLAQVEAVLQEARKVGTVQTVFFEGGEPFLYYPLLLEAVRIARQMGFHTGIVTNGYFATSVEDAMLWLKPLQEAGIGFISFSDDQFHSGSEEDTAAKRAMSAAQQLGISCGMISIDPPTVSYPEEEQGKKGEPIVGVGYAFEEGRWKNCRRDYQRAHGISSPNVPTKTCATPDGYMWTPTVTCISVRGYAWATCGKLPSPSWWRAIGRRSIRYVRRWWREVPPSSPGGLATPCSRATSRRVIFATSSAAR